MSAASRGRGANRVREEAAHFRTLCGRLATATKDISWIHVALLGRVVRNQPLAASQDAEWVG